MNSRKRKERKQMLTVAIFAAVLLLLIVVYFIITNTINGADGGETTDTDPLMDIGTFTVIDENYAELTAISYTYAGETLTFNLSGTSWVLEDDPDFPADQVKLAYMAQAVSDYGGFRRIEYTDASIENYGFDEPKFDISATYTDEKGESHTNRIRIGDQNSLTGYYYFYLDGSDYVYMVNSSLFEYFSYSKLALFTSYETPDPDVEDMLALSISSPNLDADKIDIEIPEAAAEEDENGKIEYSPAENIMSALYHDLHLDANHCVAYGVTDEEASKYGLDLPVLTVELDYLRYQVVSTEEGTSDAEISFEDSFTVYFGDKFTETATDEDGKETTLEKIYFTSAYNTEIVYSADYAAYLEILAAAGLAE